jgi:hypothetical protein
LPEYVLRVSATDNWSPPATSYFELTVSILNTTFLTPSASTTCYLDTACRITVRPSYTNRAESLLLAVSFPDNPQHSHVIGSFVRGSVSTDLKYSSDGNLMFLDWVPRLPVLRSRDVTLTARSPNSGSDESVGTSGRFLLEFPFQFAATAWGNCVPDGKGAAIDVQRRYDVLPGGHCDFTLACQRYADSGIITATFTASTVVHAAFLPQ